MWRTVAGAGCTATACAGTATAWTGTAAPCATPVVTTVTPPIPMPIVTPVGFCAEMMPCEIWSPRDQQAHEYQPISARFPIWFIRPVPPSLAMLMSALMI